MRPTTKRLKWRYNGTLLCITNYYLPNCFYFYLVLSLSTRFTWTHRLSYDCIEFLILSCIQTAIINSAPL
ncbi:hypothetical protein BDQ12DRAFT_245850 [Crucibulum laeve]|uniref:Uncharacterized protein n=1 Tax=Crucibulum laeve TaxID=68775 RepID=A0A5C3LVL4_9AGAR|nr:hypothetical protein BDQ12DRAFT_245850 [Crucibulum laeve]